MTQFDQATMMYMLSKGQLGNKTVYLSFDNDTNHDDVWTTELKSVQSYVCH